MRCIVLILKVKMHGHFSGYVFLSKSNTKLSRHFCIRTLQAYMVYL